MYKKPASSLSKDPFSYVLLCYFVHLNRFWSIWPNYVNLVFSKHFVVICGACFEGHWGPFKTCQLSFLLSVRLFYSNHLVLTLRNSGRISAMPLVGIS